MDALLRKLRSGRVRAERLPYRVSAARAFGIDRDERSAAVTREEP
jgi:hypothetical protein